MCRFIHAAWTRLVHRNGSSLLEQVQSFVEGLRPNQGPNIPLMTPTNQRVKNTNDRDLLDKSRRVKTLGQNKIDENNSSINTSPVLGTEMLPPLKNSQSITLPSNKKMQQQSKNIASDANQKGAEMVDNLRGPTDVERRRSLKNPIDAEAKMKLKEMKEDIGKRKKPPIADSKNTVDGVHGARRYLISRSTLGSPRVNSNFGSFGSGNDARMNTNKHKELQNIEKGNKMFQHVHKKQNLGPSQKPGDTAVTLPPRLQELKEKLRRMRYIKSKQGNSMQKKAKPQANTGGLKMAKELNPRRTPDL